MTVQLQSVCRAHVCTGASDPAATSQHNGPRPQSRALVWLTYDMQADGKQAKRNPVVDATAGRTRNLCSYHRSVQYQQRCPSVLQEQLLVVQPDLL